MTLLQKKQPEAYGGSASDHFPGIGGIRFLGFDRLLLFSFPERGLLLGSGKKVQGDFLKSACTEFETD